MAQKFLSNIEITHPNTPYVLITDTTNDVDFKLKAANNYAFLEVDNDNDADSTRLQFKLDGTLRFDLTPSQLKLHLNNLYIQRVDNTPTLYLTRDNINAAITNHQDLGRIYHQVRDANNTGYATVGFTMFEADADWTANNRPTKYKIQVHDGSSLTNAFIIGSDLQADFYGKGKFVGNVGIGVAPTGVTGLSIKSQSVSSQQSAIDIIQNGTGTNSIIRMGEKSTDGARFHMFDGGAEKIAFYTDGTHNHISSGDVSIGRSSQLGSAKLSVQADAGEDVFGVQCNSNNTTTKLINIFNSSGTDIASITINNDSTPDMLFNVDDGSGNITEVLKLDSSQNATFAGDVIMSKDGGPTLNMNTNLNGNTSKILLHEGTTASPQNGASIRYDGSANTFKIGVGSNVDTTRLTIDRSTGLATFANDVTVDGGDFNLTKQNGSPTINMLYDGNNPGTSTLLHYLNYKVDYDGTHQDWGGIEHRTTSSSSVRTELRFNVKSTSGNVQNALTLQGQASAVPNATFAGDVTVGGDLNITGDINSTSVTNLDVDDKTITVAKGAADSAAADGAGIVVDGASASLLYDHTGTQWEFNKPVEMTGKLRVDVAGVNLANQPLVVAEFDGTGTDGVALISVDHTTTNTASALGAGIRFKTGDGSSGTNTKSGYIFMQGGTNTDVKYIAPRAHVFYVDGHDNDITGTTYTDYGTLALVLNENGSTTIKYDATIEGHVGIGGTAGSNRTALHVMGDDTSPDLSSAAPDDLSLILSNSDAAYGMMFGVAGTGKGYIQQRRLSTATTYDLAIQPYGGKVGIGTDAPAELFDVDGTARMATGIVEGTLYVGDNIQHWGDGGTGVYFSTDTVQIKTSDSIRGTFNNYGLTGDLDGESSLFSGYSVNHQYEGNPQIDHEVFNAYAGAHKWATISLTNVFQSNRTTAWPVANFDQPFLKGGNTDQVYFNSSEDEMVIEIDHSNDPIKYTSFFGIQWTHASWRANRVKIEVYVGSSWNTIVDTTTNTQAQVYGYHASGGTGTTKVKFTLGDPQSGNGYIRISKIFAQDYKGFSAADDAKTGSYDISKYRDSSHFNNIYPGTDGTFNLGKATNRYNQIYSEDLYLKKDGPVITMESTNNASGGRINIVGLDGNTDDLFRVQDSGTTRLEIHRDGSIQTIGSFLPTVTFKDVINVEGGEINLGVADSSSGHLNAYENMTFNIDTDNDDTNRYFAWYTNSASGSGTELFKIEESGAATFSGNITAAFDSNNSGNRLRIADTEGTTAAVRTYSTSDGTGLILNHYYAVSGSPYMRYSDFVSNMGDAAATTMRFLTKPHNGNATLALTINNSQNAIFAGSVQSTNFFTSTNLNSTGDTGLGIPTGQRLGFDQSGVRSWTVKAAGGNINFFSGDGAGGLVTDLADGIITNTINTRSADLDIKTNSNSRDVRFYNGSGNVMMRVQGKGAIIDQTISTANTNELSWRSLSSYSYSTSQTPNTQYYYNKVARLATNSGTLMMEYYAQADVNYPRAASGRFTVSTWNNTTINVNHLESTAAVPIEVCVYIDDDRNVWIKGENVVWDSRLYVRAVTATNVDLFYGSDTAKTLTQPSGSVEIKPGISKRLSISDVSSTASGFTPTSNYVGTKHIVNQVEASFIESLGVNKASSFNVNTSSTVGIGASMGDVNAAELGPGYLSLSRDDTANAKQIMFEKDDAEHSYFQTEDTLLRIVAGASKHLYIDTNNGSAGMWRFTSSGIFQWGAGRASLTWDTGYAKIHSTSSNELHIGTGTNSDSLRLAGDRIEDDKAALSYQLGDVTFAQNKNENGVQDGNSGYHKMAEVTATRSGKVRVCFSAYIQSGSYYWSWRILKSGGSAYHKSNSVTFGSSHANGNDGTNAGSGYQNGLASGQSHSVHAYRDYQVDIKDVTAGETIEIWMASSTASGGNVTGNGQYLYLKNFKLKSLTPVINNMAVVPGSLVIDTTSAVDLPTHYSALVLDGASTGGRQKIQFAVDGVQMAYIQKDNNNDLVYYLPSNKKHIFYGSGSERVNIGGDLSVVGSTDLLITGSNRRLQFTSGNGTIRAAASSGHLIFQTNGSNNALELKANQQAEFSADVKHNGLTMTEGNNVDQYKYFAMTFQLTANTWTDTGIDGSDMTTGTYAMQVYVSDFNVGGGHYYEHYSGIMSWYGDSTNSTKVDEIPVHRAGHAPNNGDVQFRTQRHSSGSLMLQVKHNLSYTGALDDSDGGKIFRFKFRRLI